MKIISFNVNGLRAATRYGFHDWLIKEEPDILCLQEIKLQKEQLPKELFNPPGYHTYLSQATKKGEIIAGGPTSAKKSIISPWE